MAKPLSTSKLNKVRNSLTNLLIYTERYIYIPQRDIVLKRGEELQDTAKVSVLIVINNEIYYLFFL